MKPWEEGETTTNHLLARSSRKLRLSVITQAKSRRTATRPAPLFDILISIRKRKMLKLKQLEQPGRRVLKLLRLANPKGPPTGRTPRMICPWTPSAPKLKRLCHRRMVTISLPIIVSVLSQNLHCESQFLQISAKHRRTR